MLKEIIEAKPANLPRIDAGLGKRRLDRPRQLSTIKRIDDPTDFAIAQCIDAAVAVTSDHGETRCRCLDEHDAEPLLRTRHNEHVGHTVIVREVARPGITDKNDLVLHSGLSRYEMQPFAIVTVTNHEVHDVGI